MGLVFSSPVLAAPSTTPAAASVAPSGGLSAEECLVLDQKITRFTKAIRLLRAAPVQTLSIKSVIVGLSAQLDKAQKASSQCVGFRQRCKASLQSIKQKRKLLIKLIRSERKRGGDLVIKRAMQKKSPTEKGKLAILKAESELAILRATLSTKRRELKVMQRQYKKTCF